MTITHERIFQVPPVIYPFSDYWMEVDGLTLHYVDEGEGPVLLFFHGNPTWSMLYRNQIRVLSQLGFRCICIDMPGYGFSERPPKEKYDYLPETQSAILEKAIDQLGLKDIISWHQDWGGPIGLGLAGRRPELFKGFVIGNTWGFRVDTNPEFEATSSFSLTMGAESNQDAVIKENFFLQVALPFLRQGQDSRDPSLGNAVVDAYMAPWAEEDWRYPTWISPNQIALGTDYIEQVFAGLSGLNEKPVLYFWGLLDVVCTFALYEHGFSKLGFSKTRLVELPEAHHFYMEDCPERVIKEFLSFFFPDESHKSVQPLLWGKWA